MSSSAATPVTAPQRARCRQIAPADLDALPALLTRGFPTSTPEYWTRGFARWLVLPHVEGAPQFGYALEVEQSLVGVILLIPSQRGAQIICNLSSWYVEPEFRAYSTLLISMATKLKHVTYLNASPAPHTWRTLEAQGFRPYNFGRSAVFSAMSRGSGAISDVVPHDLPERDLLCAHAAMGCVSVVCHRDGAVSPFVFKPRRLDRPPVKVMELIYSRDAADFARCAPALGRHFLKRGVLGLLCDGEVAGLPSHYVAGKEPRYFKGPYIPTDLAFTEKVIFG
jgi:hypothetical protein